MKKSLPLILGMTLIVLTIAVIHTVATHEVCTGYRIGMLHPDQIEKIKLTSMIFEYLEKTDEGFIENEVTYTGEIIMFSTEFSANLGNGKIKWRNVLDSMDDRSAEILPIVLTNTICQKIHRVDDSNLIIIEFCGDTPTDVKEIDPGQLPENFEEEDDSKNPKPEEKKPERKYGNQKVAQLVH